MGLPLEVALAAAVQFWVDGQLISEQTLARTEETLQRLVRRAKAHGATTVQELDRPLLEQFITAPTRHGSAPELATCHARRTAVRAWLRALRALGHSLGDPTLDVRLTARPARHARPLTDLEILLGRTCAAMPQGRSGLGADAVAASLGGTPGSAVPLRAVAWALAEATAITSEITAVTVADLIQVPVGPDAADATAAGTAGRPGAADAIDADQLELPLSWTCEEDSIATGSTWPQRIRPQLGASRLMVRLPGTSRHDPRIGAFSAWGETVVRRRLTQLRTVTVGTDPASVLLAYGGAAPPGGAKAQASVCNAVRDVLHLAGLSRARGEGVRPASVRAWAGRSLYGAGTPLHEVARALGCRSLDTTADDIGLHWRQDHDTTGPADIDRTDDIDWTGVAA